MKKISIKDKKNFIKFLKSFMNSNYSVQVEIIKQLEKKLGKECD